jgi:hypothetical protein
VVSKNLRILTPPFPFHIAVPPVSSAGPALKGRSNYRAKLQHYEREGFTVQRVPVIRQTFGINRKDFASDVPLGRYCVSSSCMVRSTADCCRLKRWVCLERLVQVLLAPFRVPQFEIDCGQMILNAGSWPFSHGILEMLPRHSV